MTWEILAALITIISCLIALGGVLVAYIIGESVVDANRDYSDSEPDDSGTKDDENGD